MQTENTLYSLFPTPVLKVKRPFPLTSEQVSFLQSLEMVDNVSNKVSENMNVLFEPCMKSLHDFLLLKSQEFFNILYNPVNEDLTLYITQSWVNTTDPNYFHHKHSHPNSVISGVFYIDTDKDLDKIYFHNEKLFHFHIQTKEYNPYNSLSWNFSVEKDDLFLFPSTLTHHVELVKNSDKRKQRISLSFNTFLKGTLGEKMSASQLILE